MSRRSLSASHTAIFAGVLILGALSLANFADRHSSELVDDRYENEAAPSETQAAPAQPQIAVTQTAPSAWPTSEGFGADTVLIDDYEPAAVASTPETPQAQAGEGSGVVDPTRRPIPRIDTRIIK